MLVPFKEKKTQRSIMLPDRLWEFAKENGALPGKNSYTDGVRFVLEKEFQKRESWKEVPPSYPKQFNDWFIPPVTSENQK